LDGENTVKFERAIAQRCHRKFAVTVNSCTQGLLFALMSSVPATSRVLIPAVSFAATINSVLMTGHEPVICDIDANGLIDLESMNFGLNGNGVNTIMYANLFGHVIDWDRFKLQTDFFNENMFVIEDAAQSFGARYRDIPSGKLGDVSVLSFDPTKNLPNYGSGGMILTDDIDILEAVTDLKDNGKLNAHSNFGTNSKMSESDCAQMLVKLKYFDSWQQRRHSIATYYADQLSAVVDVALPGPDVTSAWHKFVLRTSQRHALADHLKSQGIETRVHYDRALYDMPVGYDSINYATELFREATAFTTECLSLPIYPELQDSEVEQVVETVRHYLR
jgi:dTDP-4-amino-4,6-dideoxygalactose transaminase